MPYQLPPRPDLAWLKKAAKERLQQLRAEDPAVKLHQAQRSVSADYGFKSWRALKAHVDTVSLDGQIISAAIDGRAGDLDRLLAEHPARISVTGGHWNRPLLHLAADKGHLDCIKVLIRRGFDIHLRDAYDQATALHWAAQGGHLDVVRQLVEAGGEVDGTGDAHEAGVIGWATCFDHVRAEVADYLLARGAKPTIFAGVALDRGDLVRNLATGDKSVLAKRMSRYELRRTALHLAVLKNKAEMVDLLLELGANPLVRDDRGNTPLNYVTGRSDARMSPRLLAAGADPSEQSQNRFERSVPILSVKSVPDTIRYYVEKLGFQKNWDWGSPPTFGSVRKDEVEIFLCQGTQGAPGMWISIFVNNVDVLHEDYVRRGAIIKQPPTNFPWGLREMNVADLDGHRIRFGSDATGPPSGAMLNEAP